MRHPSTRPLLAPALLLLLGTIALVPAPAVAATCTTSDVTVVVQFPNRTEVGCAKGDPSSGYDALKKAGFSITYAQGNGAGALCRIDGYPSNNPCTSMPPGDAYWAYFTAEPGGDWVYSTRGGGSSNPKPGSVEGWRFGGGEKPSGKAPAVSTPAPPKPSSEPSSKPSSKPTKKPASKPASTSTAAAPDATATVAGTPTASPSEAATGGAATDAPSATTAAPTVDSASTPDSEASGSVTTTSTADPEDGGLSWVWGLVLLAVLGAAGAGVVISRRQG